jgi:hypothetical protein
LHACVLSGQTELASQILTSYFASFAAKNGNVARVGVDGHQGLRYVLSLGPEEYRPTNWRPANPSQLLPVLLLFGTKLNLDSAWQLRELDRLHTGFFIPKNYRDFGQKVIEDGDNFTHQIGFGIWKVADFVNEFSRRASPLLTENTQDFPREGIALCILASLLFPDRLPLMLEYWTPH